MADLVQQKQRPLPNPRSEDGHGSEPANPSYAAGALISAEYDYIEYLYTGFNITTINYKKGGAGGTTVATKTITYNGDDNITSVTVS